MEALNTIISKITELVQQLIVFIQNLVSGAREANDAKDDEE